MRLKLELLVQPDTLGRSIPINYQYELSSAIYKVFKESGIEWLHENGYMSGTKIFRLFTFSNLQINNFALNKQQKALYIKDDRVYLYISILPQDLAIRFVEGILTNRFIRISNKHFGVEFAISQVESLPNCSFDNDSIYESLSPICVSKRRDDGMSTYLSPFDSSYKRGILTGLQSRYLAFYGKEYEGESFCELNVINEPKAKLIQIKSNTPQETYIRGYHYKFKLHLPEELMKISYETGLGEKGAMGFGMFQKVNDLIDDSIGRE